jgi:cysteinyl-tRNA synthetase
MLTVNGQKMSKSLGNSFLPRELFTGEHELLHKGYSPMVIRFFMLQAHYRSTLDFSNEALDASEKGFRRLMNAISHLDKLKISSTSDIDVTAIEHRFIESMNDDFNTPILIAELFDVSKIINSIYDEKATIDEENLLKLKSLMHIFIGDVLGLSDDIQAKDDLSPLMNFILKIRKEAKENKDYATSDKIRIGLNEIGYQLKDGKEETSWSKS